MSKSNKNSYAYQKYVKRVLDREKAEKKRRVKSWWCTNWIALASLLVSVIALGVALIK